MAEETTEIRNCSFCGKSQDEVRKLIAGENVHICDECVDLCNDIIAEECERDAPEEAGGPSGSDPLVPSFEVHRLLFAEGSDGPAHTPERGLRLLLVRGRNPVGG
jgi:hypothetical protein